MASSQVIELLVTRRNASPSFGDIVTSLQRCNVSEYLQINERWDENCAGSVLRGGRFDHEVLSITANGTVTKCSFKTECFEVELKSHQLYSPCAFCIFAVYGSIDSCIDDVHALVCGRTEDVVRTLHFLKGAFAIAYVSFKGNCIHVVKDEIGLKSLLVSISDDTLHFSNVATSTEKQWYELHPLQSLYIGAEACLINRRSSLLHALCLKNYPDLEGVELKVVRETIAVVKQSLVESLLEAAKIASHEGTICVLFSGGVDSAVIAGLLAQESMLKCIELVNFAFRGCSAPDRISAMMAYEDLFQQFPNVEIHLLFIDADDSEYKDLEAEIYGLSYPNATYMDLNICTSLYLACGLEGHLLPREFLKSDAWQEFKNNDAVVRALSIGITVTKSSRDGHVDTSPTATASECMDVFDTSAIQREIESFIESTGGLKRYKSKCKAVLIGSGADELFGGYARHASISAETDANFSIEQVTRDIMRLWKRNLGRDDRAVNARGVRAIYPFLNERVIKAVTDAPMSTSQTVNLFRCPAWFKEMQVSTVLDLSRLKNWKFVHLNRTVYLYINKWILREIAMDLGLRSSATFKKRAIQFGTKSAKVFNQRLMLSQRQAAHSGSHTHRLEQLDT